MGLRSTSLPRSAQRRRLNPCHFACNNSCLSVYYEAVGTAALHWLAPYVCFLSLCMISGFILGHKYSPSLDRVTRCQRRSQGDGRPLLLPNSAILQNHSPVLFEAKLVNPFAPIDREHFAQTGFRAMRPITGLADVTFRVPLSTHFQSFESRLPTRNVE